MDFSWKENRSAHVDYYTRSVEAHGHSRQAVGWGSVQSQETRFRVLAEIGLNPASSILDVGCGLGDLYGYLTKNFNVHPSYLGIDITPAMIQAAQAKFPEGKFIVGDLLAPGNVIPQVDFVLASGIFALLDIDRDPYRIMRNLIAAMFRLCRIGVAFNSLSSWTPNPEPRKFFVDPVAALTMCREIAPWVTIRHDYMAHDFTIYLYRSGERKAL